MDRTKLNRLPMPDWLSDENRAQAEQLNADIDVINQRRRKLDAVRSEIRRTEIDELDPDLIGDAGTLRECFAVMRDERSLRLRISEWIRPISGEWRKALQARRAAIADAQKSVLEKLVKIGYVGTGNRRDSHVRGSISPDMVNVHPDVCAARDRHKALQHNPFDEYGRQNLAAIQSLDVQLESMRDRAIRV